MRKKFTASTSSAMLQISTELGKNSIIISVADSKLNWKVIDLNEEQSVAFKTFMRENDI